MAEQKEPNSVTIAAGYLEHSQSYCSVYPQWRKQVIASVAVT